jgi:hypothetical protein
MTGPDAEQDVFRWHATSVNVPPRLPSRSLINTLDSWSGHLVPGTPSGALPPAAGRTSRASPPARCHARPRAAIKAITAMTACQPPPSPEGESALGAPLQRWLHILPSAATHSHPSQQAVTLAMTRLCLRWWPNLRLIRRSRAPPGRSTRLPPGLNRTVPCSEVRVEDLACLCLAPRSDAMSWSCQHKSYEVNPDKLNSCRARARLAATSCPGGVALSHST